MIDWLSRLLKRTGKPELYPLYYNGEITLPGGGERWVSILLQAPSEVVAANRKCSKDDAHQTYRDWIVGKLAEIEKLLAERGMILRHRDLRYSSSEYPQCGIRGTVEELIAQLVPIAG